MNIDKSKDNLILPMRSSRHWSFRSFKRSIWYPVNFLWIYAEHAQFLNWM